MKKISVIIPCYNCAKYIDRCLQSVVSQSIGIDNLEIILVNDGSEDSTLSKLEEWEQKYPESIIVINYNQNVGQGYARNVGIQYSSTDWIGFVDSDDFIEVEMYEKLFEKTLNSDYEAIYCKFHMERPDNILPLEDCSQSDVEVIAEERSGIFWNRVTYVGNNGKYGSLCCGLFRKKIFIENNIFFQINLNMRITL